VSFFITGDAWGELVQLSIVLDSRIGQYSQKGSAGLATGTATLNVMYGTSHLKSLRLGSSGQTFAVTVGGKVNAMLLLATHNV